MSTVKSQPMELQETLVRQVNRSRLPRHVAIIMDGNGRWAKKRGLPRVMGHRAGIRSVRAVVEIAREFHQFSQRPDVKGYALSWSNHFYDLRFRLVWRGTREETPLT